MRVLYFTRDYTTHDRRFLVALAASGHETFFLRLEDDGFSYESRPLPDGIKQVAWAGGCSPAPRLDDWMALMPALNDVIDQVRPDVIHAGPVPSCGFMAALTGFHPLLVMSWGSDLLVDTARDAALNFTAKYALRAADGLVCDCDAVRSRAQALTGFPNDRIVQFPWGVDLEHFSPAADRATVRRRLGIGDDFVVLSTRLWEPPYGIETLIEAVRLARVRVPAIRLVLLGDGSLRDDVRALISSPEMSGVVLTPGMVPHDGLAEYFQAADLYLSCTTSDGSSISLLEAMACALPVVVADAPGNREWVAGPSAGMLAPVGDAAAFSAAIVHFATAEREIRESAGRSNRATAEDRANWDSNVRRLFDTYARLAASCVGS